MKQVIWVVVLVAVLGAAWFFLGQNKPVEKTLVTADGSSTVFPITEAVAEEFQKENENVQVTVGISGTGGGFQKFCAGEVDISNASRPIKPSEVELCTQNGIAYVEVPIAYDGLAVLAHPENDWLESITVAELKKIWEPAAQNTVTHWKQVRSTWPDEEIHLYGAGVDSGTYDYFTSAIVGEEGASRGDFTSSEDDNVLVQGISGDPQALGFFGLAYYENNKDKLKLVPVEDGDDTNGKGAVAPTAETVADGTYQPLSRPIFIYVRTASLDKPEVASFMSFYLTHAMSLVPEVGYIPLSARAYELGQGRIDARTTGSLFGGEGSQVGVKIEDLLNKEEASQ